MRQSSLVVSLALATLALSAHAFAQEEHTGPHRTAVSVAGGLSVGSSGSPFLFGSLLYGQGLYDGGASFSVGGTIAHDVTPRLTVEASGLYQDRGASAWSADAGLRLNLLPSSMPAVPYFAVSGGLYGQSIGREFVDPGGLFAPGFLIPPGFGGRPGGSPLPVRPGVIPPIGRGDLEGLIDDFRGPRSRTDGMMTLGGGVTIAAGSHIFVRPDMRAQVVFSDDTRVLGLFTLNFGYRF